MMPVPAGALNVSVNFWFAIDWDSQLTRLPLRSTFLLEAVRQVRRAALAPLHRARATIATLHAYLTHALGRVCGLHGPSTHAQPRQQPAKGVGRAVT